MKQGSFPGLTTANVLGMTRDQINEVAVGEAIRRLSYLNDEAQPALVEMLNQDQGVHPRELCTAHRKSGAQLSPDELRALGLRSNAFMSRSAFAEITEAGLRSPLEAHTKTLLRALFTVSRWKTFRAVDALVKDGAVRLGALRYSYDVLPPACEFCTCLDGEPATSETALILPPADCECETANYAIRMRIDYLHDLD